MRRVRPAGQIVDRLPDAPHNTKHVFRIPLPGHRRSTPQRSRKRGARATMSVICYM